MLLIVCLPIFAAYGCVGWRVDRALAQLTLLSDRGRHQGVLAAVLLLNLYPIVTLIAYLARSNLSTLALGGGSRLVDGVLTYPFWIGLLVVVQLVPLFLLVDAARFVFWLMTRNRVGTAWHAQLILLLTVVIAVYTVVRVYNDTCRIRVRERLIYSSKLAPQTSELRIVHFSDVQLDPRTKPALVRRLVNQINALNPDLVFFSGDLVTSGTRFIDQAASLLGGIKAPYGVFACMGDHDYWAGPQWITASLREQGIEIIDDAQRIVDAGGTTIRVTGVTNLYSRRPSQERLAMLAAMTQKSRTLSIFLTHQPTESVVHLAGRTGYDLFLSGHTHGGQVVLTAFGVHLSLPRLETRFVSGFYEVGYMLVSVPNGLGLTFAPVRFQAPAEIMLIRLKPPGATQ